ncbi:histidine phosphatase family protein [Planctobacterium marinum]|uniref:Histidine phosphatase family protein n=1 Tax=Planctobacterium marinum TaxID=1631968 RepID=A0AA48KTB8_9ALTE|nr:histidine phosphatase family protein [Planctobacterium marinum]
MASIYLIRHGQASFGKEDYDALSPLGEQQAGVMGKALFGRLGKVDKIISGTMVRHKQTRDFALGGAEPSQPEHSSPEFVESADWNEYDHQAVLAALEPQLSTASGTRQFLAQADDPKKEFASLFAQAIARWQSELHNDDYPETWSQFKSRVKNALQTALAQCDNSQQLVVFTSGGPISAIAQRLLNLPDAQMLNLNWTLANCGITKVVKTPNRVILSTLNEHSHFETSALRHMITYK